MLETLKGDSTTGAKGWFGKHTDKHTINWQAITDAYAADNAFLGECAHQLVQNAVFDLPNAKKRLDKLAAAVPDLRRKSKECKTMSKQYKASNSLRRALPFLLTCTCCRTIRRRLSSQRVQSSGLRAWIFRPSSRRWEAACPR